MGERAKVGVAGRLSLVVGVLAALLALFPAAAAAEVPELLAETPEEALSGSGAGKMDEASGIAADPNLPGHVYVADGSNNRIDVFSPWGEFLFAFGWHIDAEAPEEKLQKCTVATGCLQGSEGGGVGQFKRPEAVTVDGEGNLYVAEGRGHRIQKFGPEGEFLAVIGGDVVAHGPDDSTNDEVQQLSIAASSGTFKLSFENPYGGGEIKETAALPFNASAAEVKAAVDGLGTIGGLGGSVKVIGGPGDATGSSPYEIAFEGNLGGDDVPQLKIDLSTLGPASIGATLRCEGLSVDSEEGYEDDFQAESFEYAWLRNSTPISGAESPAYTTTAADEGKSVQCLVTAKVSSGVASVQAANPVYVAPPKGVTPPPVAPAQGPPGLHGFEVNMEGAGNLVVGSAGGQKLVCNIKKEEWSGANSFAYRWYRNGVQIPGATEPTYVVTEEDLAGVAYFQCAVTASNSGTATTTEFSGRESTNNQSLALTTQSRVAPPPYAALRMEPPSNVYTANQGGAPEVCKPADTCKRGIVRTRGGWLAARGFRFGIAASPIDGAVFALEFENQARGEAAHIQVFNADGSFREEIALPREAGKAVAAIATDAAGNLYAAFTKTRREEGVPLDLKEVEVRKLAPGGPNAEFLAPQYKIPQADVSHVDPETGKADGYVTDLLDLSAGMAVDSGGNLYLAGYGGEDGSAGDRQKLTPRVLEFAPSGECLDCGGDGEAGETGFDRGPLAKGSISDTLQATAAGGACGSADVYVGHRDRTQISGSPDRLETYLRIWGPPPNTALCPPPVVPPTIRSQWATSVDSSSAELHAEINPQFWNDTHYYLEYGTSPCFEGGCSAQPAAPGSLLTHKTLKAPVRTAPVLLEGLEPGTIYHYRFVAQSGGGGPVLGLSGKSGAAAEGTFTTFARTAFPSCENDPFRIGPAALLPDCRAYEMVSPLEKESGDVKVLVEFTTGLPAVLEQSSTSGERLAYGAYRAFGDASSAPWTTQYVAARGEDGWLSHAVSPPQLHQVGSVVKRLDTEFKLFSPDLCEAWLEGTSELLLTEDAVPGAFNLYRRTDEECGGPAYEALTTVPQPHTFVERGGLELQGASADGQAAIYGVLDSLATAPPEPPAQPATCGEEGSSSSCLLQLYYRRAGGELHYVCLLPDGGAISQGGCSAGIAQDQIDLYRTASLHHAISADGSKVFWTAEPQGEGPLYLRENPGEAESTHLFGTAAGTGNLIGPATGTGNGVNGSLKISAVTEKSGHFAVGQVVSGPGIPAGDQITVIATEIGGKLKLTLEKPLGTGAKPGEEITGLGSETVSNLTTTSGAFAVGQEVSVADGSLPPVTIVACAPSCGPSATSLTLSAKANKSGTAVALSASSECTEAEKGCTLAVSAEAERASGASASRFWAAAEDGSRAIFSTFIGGGFSDLYEFDAAEDKDHLIAHKLAGVAGASADARWLYFASEEALVDEPNAQGLSPVKGRPNLYLFHEGEYRFIATLASKDVNSAFAVTSAQPRFNTTHVSADGLHVAFMSQATPTGYDNLDANNGSVASEVYLYDAVANEGEGKLLCASCNPSGARPAGAELVNGEHKTNGWVAAYLPNWENTLYTPRVLSEDGNRLFFTSSDALTPRDTNGVEDVYQWEAPGTGGCEEGTPGYSAQDEGCVNLISSGQSPRASEFVDASPDGHDVFLLTLSSLLPQDYGLIDIYDARVQGGFPQPPAPPAACEGEACQGSPEAPNDPTPSSESFEGAGNVPSEEPAAQRPKPCAKGKVRRKGKCVARHAKKHHKRRARHSRRAGR